MEKSKQEQEPVYVNGCKILVTEYLKEAGYMKAVVQLEEINERNQKQI